MSTSPTARRLVAASILSGVLLSGCARDLLFTTYTTIGVEVKGQQNIPTSVRLAYKRFEGAIIPVDPSDMGCEDTAAGSPGTNGASKKCKERKLPNAHSVLASIHASQRLFRVTINQVFATGQAAIEAARTEASAAAEGELGPIGNSMKAMLEEEK